MGKLISIISREDYSMQRSVTWCVVLALAIVPVTARAQPAKAIANFKLKTIAGDAWALDDCKDKKAIVVAFIGTQCPVNNLYMPRLVELEKAYRDKSVQFVAINSNEHDTLDAIKAHAKKFGVTFPLLRDDKHQIANRFGAERHPTVFVLDDKHTIRYQGRIDDQYGIGYDRGKPSRNDLTIALDEVLGARAVTTAATKVEGCFITRVPDAKKKADITFTMEVSRILQNRCQECHRPGQVGPMPLLTYEDASSWSLMIREVVSEQRMPPWHADPKHGKFSNDRRLSEAERTKLLAWIDAGCPEGDAKDLPPAKTFTTGWTIGQPDVVFTFPKPFEVPAKAGKGGIPYKYVLVPTNFDEDKWIQAVEARPGNYGVVHHIIVYIAEGRKVLKEPGDGIGGGLLVAYAPGDLGAVFPPGTAKKIPKGATLVFQMHYTPNGSEQTDKSSVGLIFAKNPPKSDMKMRAVAQQLLLWIPPNADNHQVVSNTTFSKDVIVYSMFPHMHLRGKDFKFEVIYPDKKRETVLSVPRYDFGWQSNYVLEKPLHLPAGTRMECTAHFDNSAKNPNNPDPSKLVRWGEQTWEEMMIGFVAYAYADSTSKKK
jgi:peroxiredoxin